MAKVTATEFLANPDLKVDRADPASLLEALAPHTGKRIGIKRFGEHGAYAVGTLHITPDEKGQRECYLDFAEGEIFEGQRLKIESGDWLYLRPI